MRLRKLTATSLISFAFIFLLAGSVLAVQHADRVPEEVPPTEVPVEVQEGSMEEGMERACEAIEGSIMTRNDRMVGLSETIFEKFENISTRVQEFYMEERVPEGHELENYNDLLSEIEERRSEAESALSNATVSAETFSCDLSNPSNSILSFNDDMREVLSSLQDYRLAIKDLIVAVASAPAEGGVPEGGE